MLAIHPTTIGEILAGSRDIGDGPDWIAMLWAYLDDSSDDKRQRFCAAGGFYSVELRWQKFERAWRFLTRDLKQPFRSTECECGFGQFSDWPKPKRDNLIRDLCQIIRAHDLGGFGSAVSVSDYRKVFPNCGLYDPYYLCVGLCIANIAEITALSNAIMRQQGFPLEPTGVRIWIEENLDTAARETQIYLELKAISHRWKPGLGMQEVSHLGKTIVGLQAADLFAREVYKHFDNRGIRPVRKPVITLSQQVSFFCWTEQNLIDFKRISSDHGYAVALASFARRITLLEKSTPIVPPDQTVPL